MLLHKGDFMKKFMSALVAIVLVLNAFSICAMAKAVVEPPVLKEISFNNATVEGKFSSGQFEYGLTLKDESVTPTLKSYKISKNAYIFVNYELDDAKHQKAIVVDVQNENIKTSYVFNYLNAKQYENNSNCNLAIVECYMGEIYPALSEDNTDYSLYIPSDLTEITLTAAAQDVGAYCEVPGTRYVTEKQNPTISINVTASNGSLKTYEFKVKRVNKTTEQIKREMADPNFTSFVEGELFYQKAEFKMIIACVIGGIIILLLLLTLFKRFAIKTDDVDENEFFDFE